MKPKRPKYDPELSQRREAWMEWLRGIDRQMDDAWYRAYWMKEKTRRSIAK